LTWRLDRQGRTFKVPGRWDYVAPPCEQRQMGAAFDGAGPRKFMRVHLLGQKGQRFLTGVGVIAPYGAGRTDGEFWRQVQVVRRAVAPEANSLFAAIWEPYAGQPVIKSIAMEGDPNNALGYAAVRLQTVDDIEDLLLADTGEQERALADGTRVQGQFAYVSRDVQGLRQASLVGGKLLAVEGLTIKPANAWWEAKVMDVNYLDKAVTLDGPFPARLLDGQFFAVGAPERDGHAAHWTTFEAVKVEPKGQATALQWRKGADAYVGKIIEIVPPVGATTAVTMKVALAPNMIAGENTQLVATTEKGDSFWRCDVKGNALYLYGNIIPANVHFQVGQRICLYEFGKGDLWRAPTKVSLRRVRERVYRLEANTPCEITVLGPMDWWVEDEAGKMRSQKTLGENATAATPVTWRVPAELLAQGKLHLQLPPAQR